MKTLIQSFRRRRLRKFARTFSTEIKDRFGKKALYSASEIEEVADSIGVCGKEREWAYGMFAEEQACQGFLSRIGSSRTARDLRFFLSDRATLVLLTFCITTPAISAPVEKTVDGVTYHVLSAPADSVRVVWRDSDGKQLRTFPEVARHLEKERIGVDTLMNGGIFEPGGVPSGLLIQDGKTLRPVNRHDGKGNFFLKPNGIFLIGSSGAAVIHTDEYPLEDVEIHQAVQSGPLLMRQGKVHPLFNAESKSRLHRNGVGISGDGEIVFAMTDFDSPKFPNLFEFAELFRELGCEDALFLDGDLSQMRSGTDIMKPSNNFGSIIAVTKTDTAESIPLD